MERTLVILKPEALREDKEDEIFLRIQQAGLEITRQRTVHLSSADAETHYAVHCGRDYFERLVAALVSGPVIILEVQGKNAIQRCRDLVGPFRPGQRIEGTIRGDFMTEKHQDHENFVHAADSKETAEQEIANFERVGIFSPPTKQ